MTNDEARARRPGDLCRLLGGHKVQHFDCDEWPDGTITDCWTKEVLSR